ncbi:MAG: helix-hairpin-helix domain-containing protein [Bacteroidaceae bacterium]|nr:helix-hairpin-helix domain-containing protein [Bacteroidaceae bacterium]
MKSIIIICVSYALSGSASVLGSVSPDDLSWESVLEELLSDESLPESAMEQMADFYEQMRSSPLNINTATAGELESLGILSPSQIEAIHAYIYMYGPMKTLGELQLTGGLDWHTRQILRFFVYAGEPVSEKVKPSVRELIQYGRNELTVSMNVPLYMRDGFREHTAEELARYPNRSYLGNKLSHTVRYSLNWRGRIRAGFTADKDADEPFGGRNGTGYDFWSPYLCISDAGPFRKVLVGNYRVVFGKGLLLGSGFSLGKSMALSELQSGQTGLKPHSSVSEYGFFRGTGLTLSVGKTLSVTVMGAHTPADAIVKGDTIVSSFKTDGYHRTELEWSRKHNIRVASVAANVNYRYNGISFGATVLKEGYSLPTANGNGYTGVSADWSVRRPAFGSSGEIAFSDEGAAVLTDNYLRVGRKLVLNMLFRSYSPAFNAPHSGALCESDVRNETGVLIGFTHSGRSLKSDGYVDLFRHPERRTGADGPSDGMEIRINTAWKASQSDNIDAFIRLKSKQKDCKPTGTLEYCITWRGRLRWDHTFNKALSCRTQLLWSRYNFLYEPLSEGFGFSFSSDWNPSPNISASLQTVLFMTDSYDSNISVYEKGLRYSFGFVTLSGHGGRIVLNFRYRLSERLQLNLKASSLLYSDREEIGASQQKIRSWHKEDINVQSIWKF